MTHVYGEDGSATPVTVIELQPNTVVALKTEDKHGYASVQLTTGEVKRPSKTSKALQGHYKEASAKVGRGLWEFRSRGDLSSVKLGDSFDVTLFAKGQQVDVCGRSKGKGFQSGIRRWNFHTQDASHGNSLSHRSNGSIGQCQTPGRVWKGKKMSGQQGNKRVTVQGLEVFDIDQTNMALLIKGAVPGANGGDVVIRPSVKVPLPDIEVKPEEKVDATPSSSPSTDSGAEAKPQEKADVATPKAKASDTAENKTKPEEKSDVATPKAKASDTADNKAKPEAKPTKPEKASKNDDKS